MSSQKFSGRELHGILLLDKPTTITSNKALQLVKKIYQAKKAGHTGSLDPLATGMLVICFGLATKISNYLLSANKSYEVVAKLGATTDTGDADGEILQQRDASNVSEQNILDGINTLSGQIEQVPPMYSAVKHQGKRLYQIAREGKQIDRIPRQVTIFKFELLHRNHDELKMHVECSKGTYIRTLIEDLGKCLGCGAHVLELRRTTLGPFTNDSMYTLNALQELQADFSLLDKLLLPIDYALQSWPALNFNYELMSAIKHGNAVEVPDSPNSGVVRIYDNNDHFYGVGKILEDGRVAPKCLS